MNCRASLVGFVLAALCPGRAHAAPAATPSFSPAGGTYYAPQTVTMSDSTPGASIYYTSDGSTPTTGSTLYTGPISVPTTRTIKAIAIADGYETSTVRTAAYTIRAATPTFSCAARHLMSA